MDSEKKKLFVVATIVLVFALFFHYFVSVPILYFSDSSISRMEIFGYISSITITFYILYVIWLFIPDVEKKY